MRLAYITEQSSEKVKVLAMMIIKLLGNHAGSHSKAEAALEKAQLEGRIAQLEQANNQLFIRDQLCGVVRYPTGYTYTAGPSPFCGCNSGCGNI